MKIKYKKHTTNLEKLSRETMERYGVKRKDETAGVS